MNDRQRLKYDSHLAVRALSAKETSQALTSSIPAWKPLYDLFLAKISYADACILIQTSNTSGITQAKNQKRAELTAQILETGGALSALALLRSDPVLQAKADLLPSDISALPDALVDDKATELLTLARAIPAAAAGSSQPNIADVGLTNGKLDELETQIETYNLLLGTPRAARGSKTAATENLAATLDEIDNLLEKGLDKLALQFIGTSFYQEYLLARDPIAVAKKKNAEETPATPASTPR